jgi:hypothetical protein
VLSGFHINQTLNVEVEALIETKEQWDKISETARGEVQE